MKKAFTLTSIGEFSSFTFYKRYFIKDFIIYGARTAALEAKEQDIFQLQVEQVKEAKAICFKKGNIACVVIVTNEYSSKIAYRLCAMILNEFLKQYPIYKNSKNIGNENSYKDIELEFEYIKTNFTSFQDPKNVDNLAVLDEEVKKILESNKEIIIKTLERGDKLDRMVERSDQISQLSKKFYRAAKSKNDRCCNSS